MRRWVGVSMAVGLVVVTAGAGLIALADNGFPRSPSEVAYDLAGGALHRRDESAFTAQVAHLVQYGRTKQQPPIELSAAELLAFGDRACDWLRARPPTEQAANSLALSYRDPELAALNPNESVPFTLSQAAWNQLCWPVRSTRTSAPSDD